MTDVRVGISRESIAVWLDFIAGISDRSFGCEQPVEALPGHDAN